MEKFDLENFKADKYVDDVPDELCMETGHRLGFLFGEVPEKKDGRMTIGKNKRKKTELKDRDRSNKRWKKDLLIEVQNEEICRGPLLSLLEDKVMRREISNIRGLLEHSGFNMDLFSTEALLKVNPNHVLETRDQIWYPEGQDPEEKTWSFTSAKGRMSLKEYAKYQRKYTNVELPTDQQLEITFGTNFDLSNEGMWEEQLKELDKLPDFCRLRSQKNMLNLMKFKVLGMNTVQMYLKVPGSRTPGHQENNNFCSVNINVGPGVTEWFAVPYSYWEEVHKLCQIRKLNFLKDSWWPDLESLEEHGIPFRRFDQNPGDLVFLNIGCVHWVQAKGVCNNIAWNVGPLTAEQFDAAVERYEWNKKRKFMSLVPMKFLSWNLARNLKTNDEKLHHSIQVVLGKSFIQSHKIAKYVLMNKTEEEGDGRVIDKAPEPPDVERAFFCYSCKEEVFNILFVESASRTNRKTYCFRCAKSKGKTFKGFDCLQRYFHPALGEWKDGFILEDKSVE